MERATFTSQIIKDQNDYKKLQSEIQKEIEDYGTDFLNLAPQVNDIPVLQGVCGTTSDGSVCEALYNALKGTETNNEVVFIVIDEYSTYELRKLTNGYVLYREMYPDAE